MITICISQKCSLLEHFLSFHNCVPIVFHIHPIRFLSIFYSFFFRTIFSFHNRTLHPFYFSSFLYKLFSTHFNSFQSKTLRMSATVFTYFNMKARGDAIKYPFSYLYYPSSIALELVGEKYEEKRYFSLRFSLFLESIWTSGPR